MNNEHHNKYLGIAHLAYGGLNALLVLVLAVFASLVLAAEPGKQLQGPSGVTIFGVTLVCLSLLMVFPHLLAGYAILKRKGWARVAGIVSAVLAFLNIPHGTVLSVYTFWFFFFSANELQVNSSLASRYALHDAPPLPPDFTGWSATPTNTRQRETEYTPPAQPPDWRG